MLSEVDEATSMEDRNQMKKPKKEFVNLVLDCEKIGNLFFEMSWDTSSVNAFLNGDSATQYFENIMDLSSLDDLLVMMNKVF